MENPTGIPEISMEASELRREDVYTDNRVGTIRVLTPVTIEGDIDPAGEVQYLGSTQVMTPAGALPLSFEIPATSLAEAVAGFGDAAQISIEHTMEELRQMQREQASQIVVPGSGMGGKLQMP